jgi:hypothetical protein
VGDWMISIIMLSVGGILFLIHLFTKPNEQSVFMDLPEHVLITSFSIKHTLSNTKNKDYVERFKSY